MMQFDKVTDQKRIRFIEKAVQSAFPSGGHILDVGCGNGIISTAVGRLGYRVTGIDNSEKAIRTAKLNNSLPNVRFESAGAEQFTAEADVYDIIICSEVLEHLQEPASLLHKLHYALKPDGILIVTVPNGYGPREIFVTKPVQRMQKRGSVIWKAVSAVKKALGYQGTTVQSDADDLAHVQFFSLSAVRRLATVSGFSIMRIQASNFIEQVFPFSLITKRSAFLQKADCRLADLLPLRLTSGFMSVWKKTVAVS